AAVRSARRGPVRGSGEAGEAGEEGSGREAGMVRPRGGPGRPGGRAGGGGDRRGRGRGCAHSTGGRRTSRSVYRAVIVTTRLPASQSPVSVERRAAPLPRPARGGRRHRAHLGFFRRYGRDRDAGEVSPPLTAKTDQLTVFVARAAQAPMDGGRRASCSPSRH